MDGWQRGIEVGRGLALDETLASLPDSAVHHVKPGGEIVSRRHRQYLSACQARIVNSHLLTDRQRLRDHRSGASGQC